MTPSPSTARERNPRAVGIALVVIGTVLLLGQWFNVAFLAKSFLLLLGLFFFGLGVTRRELGPLIPGVILSGLGLGILLADSQVAGAGSGGLFMLSFALGWVSITVASALFTDEVQWWPLIPGGIMALIAVAAFGFAPGGAVLEFVGQWWPVLLIAVGLYYLATSGRRP